MKKKNIRVKKHRFKTFWQHFKELVKETVRLLKANFKPVVLYVLLCATISITVTDFLKHYLLKVVLYLSGMTFVSLENLVQLFSMPYAPLGLFFFFFAVALIALFEIGGLQHVYAMSQIGRETDLLAMVASGMRTCRKALQPRNWLLIMYLIVFLPITNVLAYSTATFGIKIPEFVSQSIMSNELQSFLFIVVSIFLSIAAIIWVFSLNIFVLEDHDFAGSCLKSGRLNKGHYFETSFMISLIQIIIDILINSLAGMISANLNYVLSFNSSAGVLTSTANVVPYLYMVRKIVRFLISPAISHAALTVLFFRYLEEKEMISSLSPETFKQVRPSKKFLYPLTAMLSILLLLSGISFLLDYSFLFEPVAGPLVCAHRGDNTNAPENTMEAFNLAAYESLSWIELDVHQTIDDVVVVNHDENMLRVTGVDMTIHDHTYAQLKELKYKDSLPGDYEDVTIPTLKEVLELAHRMSMKVQIEIKDTIYDRNLEQLILDDVNATGMHDDVLIISLHQEPLKRIKALDPTIKVAYCMTLALEQIEDNEWSDWFSIEENNITAELVQRLHSKGKRVFSWVTDSEDNLQYLVSCDVDVIGTDNPIMIINALYHTDYSGGFSRVFNVLIHRFLSK